jgi:hypothetical protein
LSVSRLVAVCALSIFDSMPQPVAVGDLGDGQAVALAQLADGIAKIALQCAAFGFGRLGIGGGGQGVRGLNYGINGKDSPESVVMSSPGRSYGLWWNG